MSRTTARLAGPVGALVAGVVVLAGCSGVGPGAAPNGPMMSAGSGPMMGTGDRPAGSASGTASPVDDTDVAFGRGIIPHHHQAVQMARLARDRATDRRVDVLPLARSIRRSQSAEITQMERLLTELGG